MGAMHTVFWEGPDGVVRGPFFFDTWDECEKYLDDNGLSDPSYYQEDPAADYYVEHIPAYDAVEFDPSWAAHLDSEPWKYSSREKKDFIAGYMAGLEESGRM